MRTINIIFVSHIINHKTKTMKKRILVPLALLICLSFQSMAQDQHQMERQDQRLDKIITELSLDEDQAVQFTEIYNNRQNELQEQKRLAQDNKNLDKAQRSDMMEQQKETNDNYRMQLKDVLNDKQMEQLDKMMAEKKDRKQSDLKNKTNKVDGQKPEHRIMKEQTDEDTDDSDN